MEAETTPRLLTPDYKIPGYRLCSHYILTLLLYLLQEGGSADLSPSGCSSPSERSPFPSRHSVKDGRRFEGTFSLPFSYVLLRVQEQKNGTSFLASSHTALNNTSEAMHSLLLLPPPHERSIPWVRPGEATSRSCEALA